MVGLFAMSDTFNSSLLIHPCRNGACLRMTTGSTNLKQALQHRLTVMQFGDIENRVSEMRIKSQSNVISDETASEQDNYIKKKLCDFRCSETVAADSVRISRDTLQKSMSPRAWFFPLGQS